MSKKFKSQASSSRAASTAFGITSSFGFGNPAPFQTATSLLSYVTEQPDLAGITNANVVVALKNLSKKDSTTKEKALDEILEYLGNGQTESGLVVEGPLIEAWVGSVPPLVHTRQIVIRVIPDQFLSSHSYRQLPSSSTTRAQCAGLVDGVKWEENCTSSS